MKGKRIEISENEIRKAVKIFSVLHSISLFSKLTRRDAKKISRKVKLTAWKKLKIKLKR